MGQQLFGKVSTESLKLLDGFSQVDRVPEHNRGNNWRKLLGELDDFRETEYRPKLEWIGG